VSGLELHIDMDDDGLARALEVAPEELANGLLDAVEKSAAALQRDWRSNARKTARRHGKHYPSSITHDMTLSEGAVSVDIGPDRGMPQGEMGKGFEYGSVHQPPHMDGAIAFARNAQKFESAVDDAISKVIGDIE
jgi:hypothetical protein